MLTAAAVRDDRIWPQECSVPRCDADFRCLCAAVLCVASHEAFMELCDGAELKERNIHRNKRFKYHNKG